MSGGSGPSRAPHSRACGIHEHEHGRRCHSNCPTCQGSDALAPGTLHFAQDRPSVSLLDLASNVPACAFIAPVCGGCGREIDRTPDGWVHVSEGAE